MKIRELIEHLQAFDPELEVFISDGHSLSFYHTKNISLEVFEEKGEKVLDIGVGGCEVSNSEGTNEAI